MTTSQAPLDELAALTSQLIALVADVEFGNSRFSELMDRDDGLRCFDAELGDYLAAKIQLVRLSDELLRTLEELPTLYPSGNLREEKADDAFVDVSDAMTALRGVKRVVKRMRKLYTELSPEDELERMGRQAILALPSEQDFRDTLTELKGDSARLRAHAEAEEHTSRVERAVRRLPKMLRAYEHVFDKMSAMSLAEGSSEDLEKCERYIAQLEALESDVTDKMGAFDSELIEQTLSLRLGSGYQGTDSRWEGWRRLRSIEARAEGVLGRLEANLRSFVPDRRSITGVFPAGAEVGLQSVLTLHPERTTVVLEIGSVPPGRHVVELFSLGVAGAPIARYAIQLEQPLQPGQWITVETDDDAEAVFGYRVQLV